MTKVYEVYGYYNSSDRHHPVYIVVYYTKEEAERSAEEFTDPTLGRIAWVEQY